METTELLVTGSRKTGITSVASTRLSASDRATAVGVRPMPLLVPFPSPPHPFYLTRRNHAGEGPELCPEAIAVHPGYGPFALALGNRIYTITMSHASMWSWCPAEVCSLLPVRLPILRSSSPQISPSLSGGNWVERGTATAQSHGPDVGHNP